MRGKRAKGKSLFSNKRITPADAGKTTKQHFYVVVFRDHPRGCGENVRINLNAFENSGSPPRMRGKHDKIIGDIEDFRITPADAGKT